jgi:hypothetical protein
MKAPRRDVVRVLEVDGERGGKILVCILECGCFATRRGKRPPQSMPCIACLVKEVQEGNALLAAAGHDMLLAQGEALSPEKKAAYRLPKGEKATLR